MFLPNVYLSLILCLILALATCRGARAQTVSDRIGLQIDSLERGYFFLFPDIERYVQATVQPHSDSSLTLVVVRSGAADTSITLPPQAARTLAAYIDNYEWIFLHDRRYAVPIDLSPIRSLIRPLARYRLTDAPHAVATLWNGGQIEGSVLAATDSALILWSTDEPFHWRKAATLARAVHYSEITAFDAGKHIEINGRLPVFRNMVEYLKTDLPFFSLQPEHLPGELRRLIAETQQVAPPAGLQNNPTAHALSPTGRRTDAITIRWYYAMPIAHYNTYAHKRFYTSLGTGATMYNQASFDQSLRTAVSAFSVAFAVSDSWRIGATASYGKQRLYSDDAADGLSLDGGALGIKADHILIAYNPASPSFWGNIESDVSLAAQLHFYNVNIFSREYLREYESVEHVNAESLQSDLLFSIDVAATVGYRVLDFLSLMAGGTLSVFPSVPVEEYSTTYTRFGRSYEYGWKDGTATYTELNVLLGLSVSL